MKEFESEYSLLSPFICDSITIKDDRNVKKVRDASNIIANNANSLTSDSNAMDECINETSDNKTKVQPISVSIK